MIADPHEMKNLAADSKYGDLLDQYRAEMTSWRKQQNDTITGPEIIKNEPAAKGAKPVAPYVFLE